MKFTLAMLLIVFALTMVGCGEGDSDSVTDHKVGYKSKIPWWQIVINAVGEAGGWVLEKAHDGTGWLLGKNKVDIEQMGKVRHLDNGTYEADYRIVVNRNEERFTSEVTGITCDEFGIPTDVSQDKFNEAVDKIKRMLDNLQR